MKKLLTATALTSVLFAGAAFSEVKVGGNVEWTFNANSGTTNPANKATGSATLFGQEENISISYSGDAGGMAVKAGMEIEDGTSHSGYTSITSGGTTLLWGIDSGPNSKVVAVPLAGDTLADVGNSVGVNYEYENAALSKAVHDSNHVSIAQAFEGGSVYVNYAPSLQNSASDTDSVANGDVGGSGIEVGASFKFEGVNFMVARETGHQSDETVTTTNDIVDTVYAASYNFGQVAVGVQRRSIDLGTASNPDETMDTLGVTYAANDNLTIGLEMFNVEKDGEASDEEGRGITVGYNLGPIAVGVTFAQFENVNHTAGKDVDSMQIRTLTKF
jgi:hypothetical protein